MLRVEIMVGSCFRRDLTVSSYRMGYVGRLDTTSLGLNMLALVWDGWLVGLDSREAHRAKLVCTYTRVKFSPRWNVKLKVVCTPEREGICSSMERETKGCTRERVEFVPRWKVKLGRCHGDDTFS